MELSTLKDHNSCKDRKTRKPMMEKKRRDRMNESLQFLKQFLLEYDPGIARKKQGQRTSKLEKADILELTAEYLQSIKLPQSPNAPDENNSTQDSNIRYQSPMEVSSVYPSSVQDANRDYTPPVSSPCGACPSPVPDLNTTPTVMHFGSDSYSSAQHYNSYPPPVAVPSSTSSSSVQFQNYAQISSREYTPNSSYLSPIYLPTGGYAPTLFANTGNLSPPQVSNTTYSSPVLAPSRNYYSPRLVLNGGHYFRRVSNIYYPHMHVSSSACSSSVQAAVADQNEPTRECKQQQNDENVAGFWRPWRIH